MTDVTYVTVPLAQADAMLALGAIYDGQRNAWAVPAQPGLTAKLNRLQGRDTVHEANGTAGIPREPRIDAERHIKTADVTTLGELPIKTKPWEHQVRAYHWALPKKSAYLAIPMGGGKSLLTVALRAGRDHRRTLILAPKKVVPGWANQFATHGDTNTFVATLNGKRGVPQRVKDARWALDFAHVQRRPVVIVTNYESLQSIEMQRFIASADFDLVVADELQRLKAHNGLLSKTVHRLFRNSDAYRVGLSGTPLPHSPLDAFGQFRFLDDTVFSSVNGKPLTWTQFRLRYARWNPFIVGKVDEWINQDELASLMEPLMFQVDRSVLDLPEAHHVVRDVELGPKALKTYREIEREFYAQIETGEVTAANVLTRILRLQQISAGFVVLDQGAGEVGSDIRMHRLRDTEVAPVSGEGECTVGSMPSLLRQVQADEGAVYGLREDGFGDIEHSAMPGALPEVGEAYSGAMRGGWVCQGEAIKGAMLPTSPAPNEERRCGAIHSEDDQPGRPGDMGHGLRIQDRATQRPPDLGTPGGDGENTGATPGTVRERPSQERHPKRQSSGEPGALDQAAAGGAAGSGSPGLDGRTLSRRDTGSSTRDSKGRVVLEIDSAKDEMLAEVLDELPLHEPVVVFARFIHDLDTIRAVAEAQGRRYGEVSGRRDDLVDAAFPPDVDVLGVQIQAGGVGVNLTRAAVCVYYTLSYSLSDYLQSLARTHRPGQTRPVTYVHLVATGTIDGRIYKALDQRRDVVQAVMERMS